MLDKIFSLYQTLGMVSEVGDVVFPQRPNLDNAGNQQVDLQQPEALQGTTTKNEAPFWQRALNKVIGNKTRSVVAAAAITTGLGGAAHVATEGATTEKALDVVGQVITPPKLDTTLGIKTDEGKDSQGNSVDAVKDVFGDGGRMVVGGISEGADRLADRFRAGIDQDPMMGEVQYEGKRYLVKFDTTIKEYPITIRKGPSTAAEEVKGEDISNYAIDLQNGEEGDFVSGGTYPTPGGNKFEDDRGNKHGEWFRVEKVNRKTGKTEKLYVGVTLETERTEVPDPTTTANH